MVTRVFSVIFKLRKHSILFPFLEQPQEVGPSLITHHPSERERARAG